MNIQGIGQSYSAYSSSYSSPGAQGIRGGMQGGGFDPSNMTADKIIEKEDTNLDGVLSSDETRLTAEMFADADADSDGALTVDELEEMLANGPPAGGGMGAMMSMDGMMPPPMEGSGQEPMSIESILEKEDADKDGKISAEESLLPDNLFSEIDADQDGFLTTEEIEKSRENRPEPPDPTQAQTQTQTSGTTVTSDTAIKAYQQAIQSFLLNFSGSSGDSSSILTSVLNTIA